MPKKRRLEDLYVRGEDLTFDDGAGEPIVVWVQKLNPVDHSTVIRKADAARARVLSLRSQPDSEEHLALKDEVLSITDKSRLIAQITAEEHARIVMAREAEMASEDEWAEHNYLQGLRDAWTEGLGQRWAEDPDDSEAKRVLDELKRFNDQVTAEIEPEVIALRAEYENLPIEVLQEKAMEPTLKAAADAAWLREFYRAEVWLATREPCDVCLLPEDQRGDKRHGNHNQKYFGGRHEVDALEAATFDPLSGVLRRITVDPLEGKGSEETPASSDSSAPSDEPATEDSSGLVSAAQ